YLTGTVEHDGITPYLTSVVPCRKTLHCDRVAGFQRVCVPAVYREQLWTLQFHVPREAFAAVLNEHESMRMGIGPVQADHPAFQRYAAGRIELCGYPVMSKSDATGQQAGYGRKPHYCIAQHALPPVENLVFREKSAGC